MKKQGQVSIWNKIIKLIKNVFIKKDVLLIESVKENKNISKNNLIDELSRENRVRTLQRAYEEGNVKLSEISDEDKNNLINLYKQQIKTLEDNINNKKIKLNNYKNKILYIKSNLDTNSIKNNLS